MTNVENGDLSGAIVGFCNPLLDMTVVAEESLLLKYKLKANDAILAGPEHVPLYEELVLMHSIEYNAGGAGQNSMRAAQWLLPPGSTVFVGCIGKDAFGERLRAVATADGLQVEYLVDEEAPTGTCACLITEKNRSLVANLGAANNYKLEHAQSAHMSVVLERAKLIYISGYFLTVSPSTIMHVAGKAVAEGKTIALNLSAPFICEFFRQPLMEVLPYVDLVFGNDSEMEAFSKGQISPNGATSLEDIAKYIQSLPQAGGKRKARQVIITCGCNPTIHLTAEGIVTRTPVIDLSTDPIVDTTGAGDCFVGGYLSQLVQGKSAEICMKTGHFAADMIIRRSGVTFNPLAEDQLQFLTF